jgi:hypothetical protein
VALFPGDVFELVGPVEFKYSLHLTMIFPVHFSPVLQAEGHIDWDRRPQHLAPVMNQTVGLVIVPLLLLLPLISRRGRGTG